MSVDPFSRIVLVMMHGSSVKDMTAGADGLMSENCCRLFLQPCIWSLYLGERCGDANAWASELTHKSIESKFKINHFAPSVL